MRKFLYRLLSAGVMTAFLLAASTPSSIRTLPKAGKSMVSPILSAVDIRLSDGQHSRIDVGEVWANMLHNIYAVLVENFGYAADARTNPDQSAGNVVYMHLFMDSLPLLPCSPDCQWFCILSYPMMIL